MISFKPQGVLCPVCSNPIPDDDLEEAKISDTYTIINYKCWACKMDFVLSVLNEQL